MKFFTQKILIASILSLSAQSVMAHGAWLVDRLDSPTVIYGHGAHEDGYNPKKVTWIKGYTNNNQTINIEKKDTDKNTLLKIPNHTAYVGFVFDNGYWTKNDQGKWKNLPKTQVQGAKHGGHYLKYALAVLKANVHVQPIKELRLQIIPLSNPLKKKAGDKLDILLLHNGKPLADGKIIRDYVNMSHENEIITDNEGKATIIIVIKG